MAARLPETGAAILSAWFEDEEGNPIRIVAQGERCRACVEVSFGAALHDPVLELTLRDSSRRPVFATSSRWAHGPTGSYDAGDAIVARISFENCFAPGRYSLSASVSEGEGGLLDESGELTELNIYGPRSTGGIADLPHEFEIALR
jgi:hypothetical protein